MRGRHAPLLTVARNMIIDERRSARFRNESGSADLERIYDRAGLDEMDSVLDRLLLSGALAQLSSLHRGDPPVVLPGLDDCADRRRPRHRRRHSEIEAALRHAGAAAHIAGNGIQRYMEIVAAPRKRAPAVSVGRPP